jgi:hypothetical protein
VTYTHPETGKNITIPYADDDITWPALYGVLTPVCIEIAGGLKILHCTSDILDVSVNDDQIELKLYGDRDLAGEIVFEGENIDRLKSATIDGAELNIFKDKKRVLCSYDHEYKKEVTFSIKW